MAVRRPHVGSLRILLVDDDPGDRARIRRTLQRSFPDADVVDIADQQGLEEALRQGAFDVVLSEVQLPWSDGRKVLQAVRQRFPHRPVIWVSAGADPAQVVAGMRAGLSDYVPKRQLRSLAKAVRHSLAQSRRRCGEGQRLRQLLASEERYRAIAELASDYAYALAVQADGTLAYEWVTPGFAGATGYTLEELKGCGDWTLLLHPDDRPLAQQRCERWLAGQADECEWRILTRHGQERWVRDRARPAWDDAGQAVVRIYGAAQDITQQKQHEELSRQAQKMEAIGRLAGGIAHDFNNLLQVITGYSDMLLKRLGRQPQLQRFVQEIKNVADQGAILTRQLMAIGRKQPLQPQVVDVRSIIGNLIPILQRLLGEDIALSTTVDPALGCVNADPGQLEQVVLNLAVNARDAMPQGGQLSIEAANVELDAASACDLGGLAPGPYIRLRVRDTGCGMGADVLAHIFEPFFTTKEPGKGTGLGLFTAYGIVSQNGGRMTVDSAPGLGTTFTIYLPRIDQVIAAAPSDRAPELAGCGGETILLVEDEAVVRELVRQILQGAGYAVLEAADGEAALQLCERHAGPLHLLLVDVVLPGMSGPEVAKRLVSLRPQLQVLYMSGYTPDVVARYGAPEGQHAYVQKPFTPEMLQRLVRERLAAQRTA